MLTAAAAATARRRRRHAGVHVRANEGIWTCERIRKGGSWSRLGGEGAGREWLGDRTHGTSAHCVAGSLQRWINLSIMLVRAG